MAPLPSAWVLHSGPHHMSRELRTQRNPVKLVSAGTLSGACGCGRRSWGTKPCTVVIQDLATSVSARSVALEPDFRHAPAQEHWPFAFCSTGCVSTGVSFSVALERDFRHALARRFQDPGSATLSPLGCWLLSVAADHGRALSICLLKHVTVYMWRCADVLATAHPHWSARSRRHHDDFSSLHGVLRHCRSVASCRVSLPTCHWCTPRGHHKNFHRLSFCRRQPSNRARNNDAPSRAEEVSVVCL